MTLGTRPPATLAPPDDALGKPRVGDDTDADEGNENAEDDGNGLYSHEPMEREIEGAGRSRAIFMPAGVLSGRPA